MKKNFYLLALLSMFGFATQGNSQDKDSIVAESKLMSVFEEKFNWGISYHQYWGIVKGTNLPSEYFAKPCFGGSLRAEFYPLSFIGAGVGFGIQQRGAGIKNQDNYGSSFTHSWEPNYDPDSTYRERLRMSTLEVPLSLLFRTPKDIVRGVRLSGSIGILWIVNTSVKDFWHRPEDGFHTSIDVSDDYIKNDFGYQASFGVDINAAESCIFQVQLVYTRGSKNVYKTYAADGRTETYGLRLSWLF